MPTRENASGSQGTDTSSLSRPIWQVSGVLCSETKHGRDLGTRAEPFSFWKVGHQNFVGKLGGTRGLGGWILPLKRQSNICEKVSSRSLPKYGHYHEDASGENEIWTDSIFI